MRGTLSGDAINVFRGFCMGAADTVPGVSGGTVALVLGHYRRLITALSRADRTALALAHRRRWSAAARRLDLRFLVALGIGIVAGVLSLASLMHWLLDHRLPETLAVFFGLVLASGWVVARRIDRWSTLTGVAALAGAAFAFALSGLPRITPTDGSLFPLYLFASAMIAICAMILPGISGAFVLLLLGMYHPVTGLVRNLTHGLVTLSGLVHLALFLAGCACGLLAFSRLLHWLLEHRRNVTYAFLMGLMLGSLRRIWPLQMPTRPTAELPFSERDWMLLSPAQWPGPAWPIIALVALGILTVLVGDQIGRRLEGPE